MKRKTIFKQWWGIPLFVVLLPLVLVVMIFRCLYSIALYLLVWSCWGTRGRDVLFVYSDSPQWHEYIEAEILPRIQHRAILLNWSERRTWKNNWTLAPMLFRHFGGYREFNPIGFQFRPLFPHNTYRFHEPLKKWRKKNDRKDLDALLTRFLNDLKI